MYHIDVILIHPLRYVDFALDRLARHIRRLLMISGALIAQT